MEKIEVLFADSKEYDNKSILNKLNKPVNKDLLDKIEQGITIEDLESITLAGFPVLKYKTQITIHGLFPELNNSYIFGYKNIFQNKNKSIGIKYNAIDEDKRQRIAKRLKCLGFFYRRNSQGTEFNIMEMITPENFESVKSKLLTLKNKIDSNLFYGHSCLWVGQSFGVKYLCFDLYINAIYEQNIEPFLNKLGATIELLQAKEDQKRKEYEEYKQKYEAERLERDNKKRLSLESKAEQIKILEQYPKVEKTNDPGMYILRQYDYNDNLIFKVVYIYLIKGKQKPRWNYKEYITIQEALNHIPSENWSDSIYLGKLTGRKIK
jgi:hypothetical protein